MNKPPRELLLIVVFIRASILTKTEQRYTERDANRNILTSIIFYQPGSKNLRTKCFVGTPPSPTSSSLIIDSHLVICTHQPLDLHIKSWAIPRSLSDLGRIYCGKAGFGQISRSFSLNSYGYSPQTIETFLSNRLSLAMIA